MCASIAVSHEIRVREDAASRHAPVGDEVRGVGNASSRHRDMEQKWFDRGDLHRDKLLVLQGLH